MGDDGVGVGKGFRSRAWVSVQYALTALALGLAVGAAADEPGQGGEPVILDTSQELRDGRFSIALALDRPVAHDVFTLTDPYRVVVDLPPFRFEGTPPEPQTGVVQAIRHGLFRHDRGRLVFELARPFAVKVGSGRAGAEALVLTLEPTSHAAFAASAGWPEQARWKAAQRPERQGTGEILVAIDPGHGGIDPGAIAEGLVEKELVLDFSKVLAAEVARAPGLSVMMTRVDDRFLPLRERIRIAREAGAHLMLSIHADSLASGYADGLSIYTLSSRGTDDAADAFAERENRADVLAGVNLAGNEDDVTRLLIDLARRGTTDESVKLAEAMIDVLEGEVALLATRPHRRGNFFVLKAPDLPSALIELGFLSSETDRARLVDPEWQARTAEILVRGILSWTAVASPGYLAPK